MTEGKISTAIGFSVVHVTRHIMERYSVDREEAFKRLMKTMFYKLLNDPETRLYLEENTFLDDCYDIEAEQGTENLLEFIVEPY